jgi:hypothetical protein
VLSHSPQSIYTLSYLSHPNSSHLSSWRLYSRISKIMSPSKLGKSLVSYKPFDAVTIFVLLDYYWRDYTGEIPDDAVPGGYDRNLEPTYIGQLFVINHGLLPARIYKGQKSVTASRYGIHTSCECIKVRFFVKLKYPNLCRFFAVQICTNLCGCHLQLPLFTPMLLVNIWSLAVTKMVKF